ncbi:Detected protein of confused Function [Hibiscus syriacus]|uniref:Detected protein of confused Function n=1 Tax=Hibiscus syriacus TaxID=106335 RepID=A0A6A3B643_HIBSY|nr:ribonuclease P protein subunit p29-like [Hibiscus syriacus]KAE8710519.1 Detected protein of confused Function [Hibiscus syriacus]
MEKELLAVIPLFSTLASQLPPIPHQRKEISFSRVPLVCKFSNKKGSRADKILHELRQGGDSAQKYMQRSRSIKFDNWILLDNFVKGRVMSTGSQIRALKTHSKRSKRHMLMKQLKKSGVLELPQDNQKFDTFKPMHEMWKGYMSQLLKTTGKNQLAQCIICADLHGALILVAECNVTNFTGVSGIMIRETAETFGIITHDSKLQGNPAIVLKAVLFLVSLIITFFY